MAGNEIKTVADGDRDFQITLPVTQDAFSSFIRDLIGGKNELKYGFRHPVVVGQDLLSSIVFAVKERVTGQNQADLVSMRIDVQYSNNRSYRMNDIESVMSLSPIGDDRTTFVGLQMIFLVKYPGHSSPSREVVEVFFSDSQDSIKKKSGVDFSDEVGSVRVRVEYSERSWSEDIVSLIERCLNVGAEEYKQLFPVRRVFFKTSHAYVATIGSFLIVLVYCAAVVLAYRFFPVTSEPSIENTITGIVQAIEGLQVQFSPVSVTASAVAFLTLGGSIVGTFLYMLNQFTSSSPLPAVIFRMFSPDDRFAARYQKSLVRERAKGVIAFIVSIASSIVAAVLYEYFLG